MRIVFTLVGLSLVTVATAAPIELSHQGRLLDTVGQPYNGTYDVTVSLWTDQAPNGTSVWAEPHPATTFDGGYYAIRLGDTVDLGSELLSSDLYLQVQVGNTVLSPREQLVHVPLAAQAEEASLTHHIAVEGAASGPSCTDEGAIVYDTSISDVRVCANGAWDPAPGGEQTLTGGLQLGTTSTCGPAQDGTLRWQDPVGLEVCDGDIGRFVAAYPQPIFWQGGCSTDTTGGAWYYFCTDETTHETAVTGGYLTVSSVTDNNSTSTATGRITVNVPGWYRISTRHGSSGSANAYQQIHKNGSAISYTLQQNGQNTWKNQGDSKVTWMADGDFFNLEVYSNTGVNANDDGDYTVDGVDYQRRNFIRVEYLGSSW